MIEFLKQHWAWYIAGPLIGLMVPALLILGNKTLGISSSLRHICAACIPAKIPFFNYDWKKEVWNLVFVAGIILGAFLVASFLTLAFVRKLTIASLFTWLRSTFFIPIFVFLVLLFFIIFIVYHSVYTM